MQKQYPEVHSLEESLAILKKYKDDLTKEQYEAIRSNIGNFAIEDMFLNEKDIIDNVKIIKGEATANECIVALKKEWLKEKFAKYAPNGAIINFVPGKELDKYSKIIFDELAKNNYLKNSKDLNHFAKNLAKFMGEINALHPFREGNGRTQRIFLNELAKNAGYKLDLNLISKHKMIHACVEASQLKPGRLEALIKDNLKNFRQNLDLEQNKGMSL